MRSVDVKKLKYCVDPIRRGNPPSYVEDNGILVVNQGCVSASGLDLSKGKQHDPDDIKRIDAWLKKGDVLVNSTGTGTLGRVCHVDKNLDRAVFADGHVTILRDSKGVISPRYLFFLLSIQQERITVECSEGATNQIELSRANLGNYKIALPSESIQTKIANYLDRKTAELDQLIAAKKRLLTLLDEKKRALIARAVTRGLNPDVPLKDSGIPWLGLIPEHWEVERSKWLFTEIDQRTSWGEETLLSLRQKIGLIPHNDVSDKLIPASNLVGYKHVKENQIVVNRMRAASGLIAVSPMDGLVSPDYAVFEGGKRVNPYFYEFLFQIKKMQTLFRSLSKGLGTGESGFLRLYSDSFFSIKLPLPPMTEQVEIVEQLQQQLGELDDLTKITETTISLFQERRAALISAAVTGKLSEEILNAN